MVDDFFVQIKNLTSLRIDLLEISKLILYNLRTHENIQNIRKKRIEKNNELKEDIKELIFIQTRLAEKLPHKSLLDEAIQELKKANKKTTGKKTKKTETPKTKLEEVQKKIEQRTMPKEQVDKIGLALAKIEEKLRNLN